MPKAKAKRLTEPTEKPLEEIREKAKERIASAAKDPAELVAALKEAASRIGWHSGFGKQLRALGEKWGDG